MTAEIALLNRSALAFAADSAVTLRMGANQKIYDSAEKIFEFSRRQPIGVMIYNNVEHVGIPLEVLIRKYRNEQKSDFPSVIAAADAFITYLENVQHPKEEEKSYLFNVLADSFGGLNREVIKGFREQYPNGKPRRGAKQPDEILTAQIESAVAIEEARPLADYLEDISLDAFEKAYGDVVSDAARRFLRFAIPKATHVPLLMKLALAITRSSVGSGMLTGLVIGGFAGSELFPTMVSLETDGVYFGRLKLLGRSVVDIDRDGDRAELVPFAQKEMVDRFIYGIDDHFQGEIAQYVQTAVDGVMATRVRSFGSADKAAIRKTIVDGFNEMVTKLRQHEKESVLDILTFMSKKELADMAHVLVELTSKKRRFSRDQETVGGPIDVAIITRNEGFIWIRRKHYFERSENPGYYARSFAHNQGEG